MVKTTGINGPATLPGVANLLQSGNPTEGCSNLNGIELYFSSWGLLQFFK